jgi:NADPH:quinone reductase
MRATLLREFGPPDRLQPVTLADPRPGDREVVIATELAGVTFVETQIRAGRPPRPGMLPDLPVVLGNAVGGVVVEVGPDVDVELVGRTVVSSLRGTGGYAQLALAQASAPIEVPGDLALGHAVAVLADGRTALLAVRSVQPAAGERVLVLPAGGGLGSLLVQLLDDSAATVLAAAGGERKLELARSLGADLTIDYRREDWWKSLDLVDVVIDGVGGTVGRAAFERIRPGGRMLRLGMASGAFTAISDQEAAARHVTLVQTPPPDPSTLKDLAREALDLGARGRLRTTIGQTFPLERARDAHAAIEARTTIGKTLLTAR